MIAQGGGPIAFTLCLGGDQATAPEPSAFVRAIAPESEPNLIPVARYGRYTLVEMVPEPAQRDLLRQVIEISILPTLDAITPMGI